MEVHLHYTFSGFNHFLISFLKFVSFGYCKEYFLDSFTKHFWNFVLFLRYLDECFFLLFLLRPQLSTAVIRNAVSSCGLSLGVLLLSVCLK